jgi:hypothetical protein
LVNYDDIAQRPNERAGCRPRILAEYQDQGIPGSMPLASNTLLPEQL